MCGLAGIIDTNYNGLERLEGKLDVMGRLQRHRGPDEKGQWRHKNGHLGFAHRRLSIIDLETGSQPMQDAIGNCIVYNGEIYNYRELKKELGDENFRTTSDTEVLLIAYRKWGIDFIKKLRGMFSFALWDELQSKLICVRDPFGIKPFYYTISDQKLYFASEVKALLPFVKRIENDPEGFKDYLTFQMTLNGKTLFKDIKELKPAHLFIVTRTKIEHKKYWEVYYDLDYNHTEKYFREKLEALIEESIDNHLLSDVPIGAYVSGGIDSSTIAAIANRKVDYELIGYTGKYASYGEAYDESRYARLLAKKNGFALKEIDITAADFIENIQKVIYHLDYPVAGPGAFSQYMVSKLAAQDRKVILGGQGGDEIFGGYTRYLIAYFEQCIKAAIDGTSKNGNFIVTYESIIPNLQTLKNYKQLLQEFWREGMFGEMDRRYFRLINRSTDLTDEIRWDRVGDYMPYDTFREIFNSKNVGKESYFDLMTHFDFKTQLPGLLHVEDRMSMAHGLESRVPLLDNKLVEFAATIPSNIKFKNGNMKHIFKKAIGDILPKTILQRKDKMGFPTPLNHWMKNEAKNFIYDLFSSQQAKTREFINYEKALQKIDCEREFGRSLWGLLSLELWYREFHDREYKFKEMLTEK